MNGIIGSEAWKMVEAHQARLDGTDLRKLFQEDPQRAARFCGSAAQLFVDYSKELLDDAALDALLALADAADLPAWRERLFAGERINGTEDRPAWHTALRAAADDPWPATAPAQRAEILAEHQRLVDFATAFRAGEIHGASGKPLTRVLSIGIGGSLWGPALLVEAFADAADRIGFVSSLDDHHLERLLSRWDPETTLVAVSSKSFTTQESGMNAARAKAWLAAAGGEQAAARQMVAITANPEKAREQGYRPEQIFRFWDWVGGRYSVWSSIGLPAALMIGADAYDQFLAGAAAMDRHFREAPARQNLPLLLGLRDVWYASFWQADSSALLPYEDRLRLLPVYVQQLAMESNGKRVDRSGQPTGCQTGPVIWGGTGNDAQHTFYQLLHQGTRFIPVEFLIAVRGAAGGGAHRDALLANCLAQSEALLTGSDAGQAYRVSPGGRPSTTIVFEQCSPQILGALLALYEHRVFVQGICWGINSFDQWGVELGKRLAGGLLDEMKAGKAGSGHDASTRQLLDWVLDRR